MIPFTQIGVYTSINFQTGSAKGQEFSYNLTPRNGVGISAYFAYANSLDKPGGLILQAGTPAPLYNDHDTLNVISAGTAYTWKSGANVGMNFYFDSGTASSVIFPTDALGNGKRSTRNEIDLAFSTGPGLFGGGPVTGHGGLTLSIENLLNHTSAVNFNSGFSGTRFQQGRRILLSVSGNF